MFKQAVCALLVALTVCLSGCVTTTGTGGLVPFVDSKDGYSFLYPNGWLQTSLKNGPDVLFHDIIEPSENVSVMIGKLTSANSLEEIGTAQDIGLRMQEKIVAVPGSGREAALVNAEQRELDGIPYYLLEYEVKRSRGEARHDLVNVTAIRGNLYTLSVSTLESRWLKLKDIFYKVASSFVVN